MEKRRRRYSVYKKKKKAKFRFVFSVQLRNGLGFGQERFPVLHQLQGGEGESQELSGWSCSAGIQGVMLERFTSLT